MGATEELARFVVETAVQKSPDSILHEGKRCLINYMAVAIYASRDPSLDILLDLFRQEGGRRHASVIGIGTRTAFRTRPWPMGTSATWRTSTTPTFPR